jgi:hypothetical protein
MSKQTRSNLDLQYKSLCQQVDVEYKGQSANVIHTTQENWEVLRDYERRYIPMVDSSV